jgi:uncharacterized protein with HEPN domain
MSKFRTPEIILEDMHNAVTRILEYTKDYHYDHFTKDRKTIDAVLRNLTVLGEASRNMPNSFTDQHPHIEWTKIARSRHIIVHDYFDVDYEIIWKIITDYLPPLKEQLELLIANTK